MKGGEQTMAEKDPLPWGSKVLIGVLVVILVPVALAIAALVMFVVSYHTAPRDPGPSLPVPSATAGG